MGESQLALLQEMLDLLDRYAGSVTVEALESNRETWLKVRGALEVACQCTIDLGLDLVARRGLGVPQTYRETFTSLARAGLIDESLASELAAWAGLRNVLVHVYTALDLDRIVAALGDTKALRAFQKIVAAELKNG